MRLQHVPLDARASRKPSTPPAHPEAYERLLMDVIRGNATPCSGRRDEVQSFAWNWIDPIQQRMVTAARKHRGLCCRQLGARPSLVAQIERDGRTWNEEFA